MEDGSYRSRNPTNSIKVLIVHNVYGTSSARPAVPWAHSLKQTLPNSHSPCFHFYGIDIYAIYCIYKSVNN